MLLGTTRGPNIYTRPNYTYPLGIFQGILSEYLALKYGPQVVYMDFGYFLVTGYICIYIPPMPPACATRSSPYFIYKTLRSIPKIWSGVAKKYLVYPKKILGLPLGNTWEGLGYLWDLGYKTLVLISLIFIYNYYI